jgi:hypothetical protein
MKQSSSKNGKQ